MDVHANQNTFFAQHYIGSLSEFICYNKTVAMHCNHFKTTWCTFHLYKVINTSIFIDSSRKTNF